mgnify:CR=1 FL=1|tara:strand:+ start:554 stop:1591 length:1038 start_codon:yes stop_codon:yes gene_type:complete
MNTVHRRAFTIAELFAIIIVLVILIAILLPARGRTRHSSPNVVAQANLRSLNTGAAMYAEDHEDLLFHFTWMDDGKYSSMARPNPHYPRPDPAAQVQNILQRNTGRIHGSSSFKIAPAILVRHRYSHQVLLDYLTDRQPEPIVASPFDKKLIEWQENPLGYLDAKSDVPYGKGMPSEAGYDTDPMWLEDSVKQLWAFGSSYQVVPHAWLDDVDPQYSPSAESPHHMVKGESEEPLGGRKMTEVKFPSQKVFIYEEFDRFGDKKGIYAAYPEAMINMAFFDGSVRREETSDARSAYDEMNPTRVWEQRYVPLDTFPVPMGGLGELKKWDLRFRWTKGGLGGVDFGN